MSDAFDEEKQEEPLDPAVERVQVKLRRLLFGSTMIMVLGFGAVALAIFYRLNRDSNEDAAYVVPRLVTNETLRKATFPLPSGAKVISTVINGDNLAVTYELPQKGASVLLVDLKSWQVHSVLDLSTKND